MYFDFVKLERRRGQRRRSRSSIENVFDQRSFPGLVFSVELVSASCYAPPDLTVSFFQGSQRPLLVSRYLDRPSTQKEAGNHRMRARPKFFSFSLLVYQQEFGGGADK
jgi:hypothetical protein